MAELLPLTKEIKTIKDVNIRTAAKRINQLINFSVLPLHEALSLAKDFEILIKALIQQETIVESNDDVENAPISMDAYFERLNNMYAYFKRFELKSDVD